MLEANILSICEKNARLKSRSLSKNLIILKWKWKHKYKLIIFLLEKKIPGFVHRQGLEATSLNSNENNLATHCAAKYYFPPKGARGPRRNIPGLNQEVCRMSLGHLAVPEN